MTTADLPTNETGHLAPPYMHPAYKFGVDGVWVQLSKAEINALKKLAKKAKKDNASENEIGDHDEEFDAHQLVSQTLVWLIDVFNVEGKKHLKIGSLSFGNKLEVSVIPASLLGDARRLASELCGLGIDLPKNSELVRAYLASSKALCSKAKAAEIAYDRFGWTDEGFVLGSDLITPDGIVPAHTIGISAKTLKALSEKGTHVGWLEATLDLDEPKYWKHRFALLAVFAAPLLALMEGGDKSAILSLAGETGLSKTTIVLLALSAYGDSKALTVAPQSTEKAYHGNLRRACNLPVLCDEADKIKKAIISDIIYAAANGKARDTMTQKSELRESGSWETLTALTANKHLHTLAELNEATRRRIFELTIDTPLDLDLALKINAARENNYGVVGRIFLQYVVKHKAEVIERLEAAFAWVTKRGVRSEDRFAAWIITSALVGGEIAYDLQLIDFEPTDACERAVEATIAQSKQIQTSSEIIAEALDAYLNKYPSAFPHFNGKTWTDIIPYAEVRGRYEIKSKIAITSVARRPFAAFVRDEFNADPKQISPWMSAKGYTSKDVKLATHGNAVECWLITRPEDGPT